jgi:hypothetical protein
MKTTVLFLSLFVFASFETALARSYFPSRGEWETRTPQSQDLNADKIADAVAFAEGNE